jgi:allantoinase
MRLSVADAVPRITVMDRSRIGWPGDKRVAVWVVPNIEHYSIDELRVPGQPDVREYSRRDYGNRVGIWRLFDVMAGLGVRGTVALNAEVAGTYPSVLERSLELDWELMGHGLRNSTTLRDLSLGEERDVIAGTARAIEQLGATMYGWLSPSLTESWNTLGLLAEAGVEYTCDWVNDDLPYAFTNGVYSIPYTVELNDFPLFSVPSISASDFERRITDTFDVLCAEADTLPRVMCIALHPFIIGAAHRIGHLRRALTHIADSGQAWFATGHEIIDFYRGATMMGNSGIRLVGDRNG